MTAVAIDEKAMREAYAALRARVAYLEEASGLFAPDTSLDRPKGDPVVRFPPRSWQGPDFSGKRYSQCSPEFLECLASFLTWAADHPKEGKEQYASSNRLDAARARSWARRLRAKTAAPVPVDDAPHEPPPAALFEDEPAGADLFGDDEGDGQDEDAFGDLA